MTFSEHFPADSRILLLPDWRGPGPGAPWLRRWAQRHGDLLVEQDDWRWPRRGDWMTLLEETLLALPAGQRPALLVAHGLGCHLVAAWAAHSIHAGHVRAALLVAPSDLHQDGLPPQLAPWRSVPARHLPFPSLVVLDGASPQPAQAMAIGWGSDLVDDDPAVFCVGKDGDWPQGRSLLQALAERCWQSTKMPHGHEETQRPRPRP